MDETHKERLAWQRESLISSAVGQKKNRLGHEKGNQKMHQLVPASPEMTLADQSAQALAQAWS